MKEDERLFKTGVMSRVTTTSQNRGLRGPPLFPETTVVRVSASIIGTLVALGVGPDPLWNITVEAAVWRHNATCVDAPSDARIFFGQNRACGQVLAGTVITVDGASTA